MAKLTKQVNFRVDEDLKGELAASALREERKEADVARMIFEWAMKQYRDLGSLGELRRAEVRVSGAADAVARTAEKEMVDYERRIERKRKRKSARAQAS